ncbi:MAG: hypothetical protein AABM43_06825 [Actinomycetota bacterium]
MEIEIEMLLNIRSALADHDENCDSEAKAILMNPGNFDLIGWVEVLGLPVLPDERVEPKMARVLCGVGTGGHCEEGQVVWDEDGQAWVAAEPEA